MFHSHVVAVSGVLPVWIGRQLASPSRRASSVYVVSSPSGFSTFHLTRRIGLRGLAAESLSVGSDLLRRDLDGDVLHRGRLVLRHVVAGHAADARGVVLERDPELQVAADRARDLAALVAAAELADLRRAPATRSSRRPASRCCRCGSRA